MRSNLSSNFLHQSDLALLSSFLDRDMLMRYHWGLSIGHTYTHATSSTNSRSTSQWFQPPHSSRHVNLQDFGHQIRDEVTESKGLIGSTQVELDGLESEVDSASSESQSDSESVFGDDVDLYGSDLDVLDGYYEF